VNSSIYKIFFLCEDASSLERAIALKEKLAKNCGDQVLVEADFCEYARLCHPRLRENATSQAIDSDMIIVSARGTDAVPMFVQNWMSEIGALCSEKIVCAEFLHTASTEKATVFHRFMDKWASQSNTFLFSNLFPASRQDEAEAVLG
jgi:hypothetical protein